MPFLDFVYVLISSGHTLRIHILCVFDASALDSLPKPSVLRLYKNPKQLDLQTPQNPSKPLKNPKSLSNPKLKPPNSKPL